MAHGGDIYRNKVHMDFSVNLNPLGTPREVEDAIKASLQRIHCYPDPMQEAVRTVIAEKLGVDCANVIAASGASALLTAAIRAVAPERALIFEPSFSGYIHALAAAGCQIRTCSTHQEAGFAPVREDLSVIDEDIDLILVCDPSSPGGRNIQDGVM